MRPIVRMLAVVGDIALIGLLVLGALAGRAIDRGFSTREAPSGLEALVARTARKMATPPRVRELPNPVKSSDEVLAEARAHWADHCASCHGNDGSGDTEMGRLMYPRPPDMRRPATQQLTDGELYAVIKNGVRLTGMPAWGDPGDHDDDSWKLVDFIRHLPALSPAELKEMEELNPKSPSEVEEEKEEDEFLRGDDTKPQTTPHQH